jgi:hypothetical protein
MKKRKPNPKLTVLIICIALVILHLMTGWRWPLPAAFFIGLAGVASRYLSGWIDFLWMKLTSLLNRALSHVILLAIFFLLLLPVALLARLFGNQDPLNLKNTTPSNFKDVGKPFDKTSFEKLW